MRTRILTALALILVLFWPLYFGGWSFRLLLFLILIVGGYELYRVNEKKWPFLLLVIMLLYMFFVNRIPGHMMMVVLSFYLLILFVVEIGFDWFDVYDLSYVFMSTTLLALAINAVVNITIRSATGRLPIFYIIIVTILATDSGAYFGGRFFGKHKLAPSISPNKTVEGAVIGYFTGLIVSLLMGLLVMVPDVHYSANLVVVASILMPFVGQIGDLAFSSIKRYYNIKDFGIIFPGHGGVLDRIDSLIFNLLLFNCLIILGL